MPNQTILGPNGEIANPNIRKIKIGYMTIEVAAEGGPIPAFGQPAWEVIKRMQTLPHILRQTLGSNANRIHEVGDVIAAVASNIQVCMQWAQQCMMLVSPMAIQIDENRTRIDELEARIKAQEN